MIKSTAPADPVGVHSSPSAYYLWEFPEKPVSVRLSLDVVDRLERDVLESFRAITARGSEVRGEGSYIEFPFRRTELGKGDFAKSIVIDAPKAKEAPAEAPAAAGAHKSGSRATVLPFSLKRDEEPPVPAPPLKREERAPVVA